MNPAMVCDEVGYGHQLQLALQVLAASGARPFVVEAEDLLADAAGAVERYCRHVGIPSMPASLSWRPGDQRVWSRTKEWHRDAAGSSCFTQSRRTYARTVDNDEFLNACYRRHLPHYEVLRGWARQPDLPGSAGHAASAV
jgi:hypothetical protein